MSTLAPRDPASASEPTSGASASRGLVDPLERLTLIVRARRVELIAAARREGASPEEALECVQDALCTFLRLERDGELPLEVAATDGDGGRDADRTASAAVFTMVRNAARNLRRRHFRVKPHASLDEAADASESALPSELPNAEELLLHAEDTVRLRACLSELCGVQRAVVTLRLLEERSGEDVAEALGLSRSYVDVLVHRAKGALRVCMLSGHRRR